MKSNIFRFFLLNSLLLFPLLAEDLKTNDFVPNTLSLYQDYANQVIHQKESEIQSDSVFIDVNKLNAHPDADVLIPAEVEDFNEFKNSEEYVTFREKANQLILQGGLIKEFYFSFSPLDGKSTDITDKQSTLLHSHNLVPSAYTSVLPVSLEIREILQYRLQLERLARECGQDPVRCVKNAKLIFHVNEVNRHSIEKDLKEFNWFEFSPENIVLLEQPMIGVFRIENKRFVLDSKIKRRGGHGYALQQTVHPKLGKSFTFSSERTIRQLSSSALAYLKEKGAEWMLSTRITDLTQLTPASLDRDCLAIVLYLFEKGHSVVLEMVENPNKRAGAYWVRNRSGSPFVAHTNELLNARPGLQRPLDRLIGEKAWYSRFSHYIHLDKCKDLLEKATLPIYIQADITSSAYRLESYLDDITRLPEIHAAAFHKKGTAIHPYKSDEDVSELLAFSAAQDADPEFKAMVKKTFLMRARKHLNEPLQFQTNWVKSIWGGGRIAELKNLSVLSHEKIGETWEVSAQSRNPSQLIINDLPQPISLEDLMNDDVTAEKIVGSRIFNISKNWFPVLYKFLDANKILSIQVHPSTQIGKELGEREPGKSETWVVIDAKPDASVYVGLKEETTWDTLKNALESNNNLLPLMKKYPVKPGDVLKNQPGVVHAIGAGVLIAEIQGNSDITYRLHDHNRYPLRPLHIPQALKAINLDLSRNIEVRPDLRTELYSLHGSQVKLLAKDPYYEVRHANIKCHDHVIVSAGGDFQIVSLLAGHACLYLNKSMTSLHQGQTVLIPASSNPVTLMTRNKEAQVLFIKPGEAPHPILKPKPIQYVGNTTDLKGPIHLAVSVGGTKLLLGAMTVDGFVKLSPRIEWKKLLENQNQYSPEGFIDLFVDKLEEIIISLKERGVSLGAIQKLGIAWPGPGDYKKGIVSATFIPGFNRYPLQSQLSQRLQERLGLKVDIEFVLDAWADAFGEMKQDETLKNWMYLNIATGIAVGIVKDERILDSYTWSDGKRVETGLGQIGRHLIRRTNGEWEYRPTLNGEIPPMVEGEVRFTDWAGGPGVAKRFIHHIIKKSEITDVVPSYFFKTPIHELRKAVNNRDAIAIQTALSMVQQRAQEKNELAIEMIRELGKDIGLALRAFADAFPQEFFFNQIIVGGGLIENLGRDLPAEKSNNDILLASIVRSSQIPNIHRTRLDARRELLAFKPDSLASKTELFIFDMDGTLYNSPELARLYKESIYELYLSFRGGTIEKAIEAVENKRKELSKNGKPSGDRNVIEALGFSYKDMISSQQLHIGDPSQYVESVSGLKELLMQLKKRYRLVLATNNTREAAFSILKKLEIYDFFEKIYPQDLTELHKPDRKLFQLIQAEMDIPFENIISVGDREEADLKPARDLGMQTLLVEGPKDLLKKISQIFLDGESSE